MSAVALAWAGDAFATNIDYKCGDPTLNTKLCRNGSGSNSNCNGAPGNPGGNNATDTVDITGIALGTQITFTFTKNSVASQDQTFSTTITGQGDTVTVPNPDVETFGSSPQSYVHTVVATDLTESPFQSNFQIMLQTDADGRIALDYTISCQAPPPGKLTIKKDVPGISDSTQFSFAKSGQGGNETFNLTDGGTGKVYTASGTYTIVEDGETGYSLSNIACSGTGANGTGDSINVGTKTTVVQLDPGEDITCTYTNTKNPKLTLLKTVVNSGGGTAADTAWTLKATGPTTISGVEGNAAVTNAVVAPGSYTLSELNGPADYSQTGLSCTGAADTTPADGLTIAAGENVTCTFTNTFKADPKLKITKSSDKTSYKVGETITYSIVAENIGNVTLQNVEVTDDDVNNLSCLPSNPVASLAPGAKITCTASHIATADDAKYGSFTNEACVNDGARHDDDDDDDDNYSRLISSGDYSDSGAARVCDTETDEVVQPKGKLTIVKNTIGGEGTFKFNWYGPSSGYKSLTTANHVAQSYPIELVAGYYTIHESEIPDGWELISSECVIVDNEKSLVSEEQVVDDGSEAFTIAAYKDTICTFTNRKKYDEPMDDVTELFINRRLDNLLTEGPDRARLLRRLSRGQQQSLKDGGPVVVTGSLKDDEADVKVAASLSGVAAYNQAVNAGKLKDAVGFEAGDGSSAPSYGNMLTFIRPTFDVWVEGHYKTYDDHTAGINRDGRFGILYVGADYAVSDNFLLGALVQFDDTRENLDDNPLFGGSVEGRGWMAGPYVGWILSEGLLLDARIAWGQSSNDIHIIDPIGGDRTGSFDTDRWLASVSLTGNWTDGLWRFSPEIALSYGEEDQDAYVNSLGQQIGAHKATIGRLTFGPEVGYTMTLDDGSKFEPHASIKGIWNFAASDLDITSVPSSGNESLEGFRARVEAGFLYTMPSGVGVRGAVNYDGIGDDDFKAWGGEAWVNIPLN